MKKKYGKFKFYLLSLSLLTSSIVTLLAYDKVLWINTSSSLPYGLYYSKNIDNNFKKGDLVLSCLPSKYANLARTRNYVNMGICNFNTAPVGKHIVAIEGDHVKISNEGVYINGNYIQNSLPRILDNKGQNLNAFLFDGKLKEDEILLMNNKEESFDSRYFGIVNKDRLIRYIIPLFTI